MLREMSTTYGRSLGGYAWAILEPVLSIAFLTLVFSLILRTPPLGTDFEIFYATGLLPFIIYRDTAQKLAMAIQFSKSLLSYPSVTFLDAIFARFVLNIITGILVFSITTWALLLLFDPDVVIDPYNVILSLLLAFLLGAGVGVLNCFLFAYLPDWQRIWNIFNRPMFILSGTLFIFESIPPAFQNILWFNPVIHVVGIMRKGFYPTYEASYVSLVFVFLVSLISLVLGLFFLRRWTQNILNL